MNGQQMCAKCFKVGVQDSAVLDEDLRSFSPTFSTLVDGSLEISALKWCKGALSGDCQFDGKIKSLGLMHRKTAIAAAFCSSLKTSFGHDLASKMLSSYNLNPNLPDEDAFHHVLEICIDIDFYAPTLAFAEKFSQTMPVYIYRFNEPSS